MPARMAGEATADRCPGSGASLQSCSVAAGGVGEPQTKGRPSRRLLPPRGRGGPRATEGPELGSDLGVMGTGRGTVSPVETVDGRSCQAVVRVTFGVTSEERSWS
jgi:hypothetical protein